MLLDCMAKDDKEGKRKYALTSIKDNYISSLAAAGIGEQASEVYGKMFTQGLYAQAIAGGMKKGISKEAYSQLFGHYLLKGEAIVPENHKKDAVGLVSRYALSLKVDDIVKYLGIKVKDKYKGKLAGLKDKYVSDLDEEIQKYLVGEVQSHVVESALEKATPEILKARKVQRSRGLEKMLLGAKDDEEDGE